MTEFYIQENIRRIQKNRIIACVICMVVILSPFMIFNKYYYNFFNGPFKSDETYLNTIKDISSEKKVYVQIEATEIYETGIEFVLNEESETSSKKERKVYAVPIGDKLLLVDLPYEPITPLTITGEIVDISEDVEMYLDELLLESEIKRDDIYNFLVEDNDYSGAAHMWFVLSALILIGGIFNIIKVLLVSLKNKANPVYGRALKSMDIQDFLDKVDKEINEELKMKNKKIILTKSWMIVSGVFTLYVIDLDDIMWFYEILHIYNFIFCSNIFYVHLRNRKRYELLIPQKYVSECTDYLIKEYPWIMVGNSKDNIKAYKHNLSRIIDEMDNIKETLKKDKI